MKKGKRARVGQRILVGVILLLLVSHGFPLGKIAVAEQDLSVGGKMGNSVNAQYIEIVKNVRQCLVGIYDDGSVEKKGEIIGTGFFIAARKIATAFHVIRPLDKIYVYVEGINTEVECTLLNKTNLRYTVNFSGQERPVSANIDVAILEVADQSFSSPFLQLGQPEHLQIGEGVSLYGYPKEGIGLPRMREGKIISNHRHPILSKGIVSGLLNIENEDQVGWKNYLIYHNASIGSGSSGSPIFLSETGEVIGVHIVNKAVNTFDFYGQEVEIPGPISGGVSSQAISKVLDYISGKMNQER